MLYGLILNGEYIFPYSLLTPSKIGFTVYRVWNMQSEAFYPSNVTVSRRLVV